MKFDSWRLEIFEARTAVKKLVFSSSHRFSSNQTITFGLKHCVLGVICQDMTFVYNKTLDNAQQDVKLLDTVKLYINNIESYTGRIVKIPSLGLDSLAFVVQGSYNLAKLSLRNIDVSNYSGALWPKVKQVLESKLGIGNVLVPENLDYRVYNWTVESNTMKLDAFCRLVGELTGQSVLFGYRPDLKFVIGPRALDPVKTLGYGTFEEQEAQLANRIYATTGYDRFPVLVFEEPISLLRDGPLEEEQDMSGLVQRFPMSFVKSDTLNVSPPMSPFPGKPISQYYNLNFSALEVLGNSDQVFEFTYSFPETDASPFAGGLNPPITVDIFSYSPDEPTNSGYLLIGSFTVQAAWRGEPFESPTYYMPVSGTTKPPMYKGTTRILISASNMTEVVRSVLQFTGLEINFTPLRDAAKNLFISKYGPVLQASVEIQDRFILPSGRGRYKFSDRSDVVLFNYSGEYTISSTGFISKITGGSKSRYTSAQISRDKLDNLSREIERIKSSSGG